MRGTEMNHIDTRDPSSRQISTGYEEFPSNDTESTVDHSDFISAKESKENITAERSQIPPEIGEDNDTKRDRLKELLSVIAGTLRKVKDLETMPEYCIQNFIPGRVNDLEGALSYGRAANLLNIKDVITDIRALKDVHVNLTLNDTPLDTMNRDHESVSFREDDKKYFYPRCPKGFPTSKLARLNLGDDETSILRYEAELCDQGSWYKMLEKGLVEDRHVDLLFYSVSRSTNGSPKTFVENWLGIQQAFHVDPSQEARGRKPIDLFFYGILVFSLIHSYRPFVRGNGRLARLFLSHCMIRYNVLPPRFDTRCSYSSTISKMTARDRMEYAIAIGEEKSRIAQKISDEVLAFARFISQSSNREHDLAFPAPDETRADPMLLRGLILEIVSRSERVLFHDLGRYLEHEGYRSGDAVLSFPHGKEGEYMWRDFSEDTVKAISSLLEDEEIRLGYSCGEEYHSYREPSRNLDNSKWVPRALVKKQGREASS